MYRKIRTTTFTCNTIHEKEHLFSPETQISEILETDSITIVNRPLVVKDAESVSMSRYFEDVTMKEVGHVTDKAVYAIRRRFGHMFQEQQKEEKQSQKENETPVEKEEENSNAKKIHR